MIAANQFHLTSLIAPGCPTVKKIVRYARSKGLQSHDADDIAQETALHCLLYVEKHPDRLRGEGTVVAIAKKRVLNEYRRRNQKHSAST